MKLSILFKAAELWYDQDADHMAAAVSYYAIFAVVPLLFLSITITDLIYDHSYVVEFVSTIGLPMGEGMVLLFAEATVNLARLSETFWIPLIGAVFFSGMVVVLCNTITSSIHHIWKVPHQGIAGWIKKSRNAIVFILVFELYLLGLMAVNVALSFIEPHWLVWQYVFNSIYFLISTTILFSLAYHILPWEQTTLKIRLQGAFIASLLLLVVKLLVAWYLTVTPFPDLFGASGLVVAFLMWVYATACVFFYGVALVYVLSNE